jgi:desulfoferrodoxin (superoxide reductase-like protein)
MTATTAETTPADNKKHIKVVEKKNDDIIDIDDDVEDIFNLSVGGIFRGT